MKPYFECNGGDYDPRQNYETLKYGLLFSLYLVKASENAKIHLEIPDNESIRLNTRAVTISELKEKLLEIASQMKLQGIPYDEIVISLKVASEVKMGLVSKVQQIMRDIDLRKVLYSTTTR